MGGRESIHYGFRLNINNPRHLEIHKILRDLNPEVYKSKSSFIIEALENQLLNEDKKKITQSGAEQLDQQGGYATVGYVDDSVDKLREVIRKELEAEIKQELFSMFIAATRGATNITINQPIQEDTTKKASAQDEQEAAKVLNELTDSWL